MTLSENQFLDKIELVEKSIKILTKKFQENPANFFYEEDLRAFLFYLLCEAFNERQITVSLKQDHFFKKFKEKKILPIKTEYGRDKEYFSKYNISNIDIGILSEKSIYDEINNYQRYCDIIIEIKYSNEKFNSKHGSFIDDIKKIHNAKHLDNFFGLALCFDLHGIEDMKCEEKFFNDYRKSNVEFEKIELQQIKFTHSKNYAIYITPDDIFMSTQNSNQ